MFNMTWEKDSQTKKGCCYPENRTKPIKLTKALGILTQQPSTSATPPDTLFTLGDEQRRAVEAYRLQVEQRRLMAIERARRATYL